jgi:hypothetical protein
MLCGGFLLCGAIYIYGLNMIAIHSLSIEELEKHVVYIEEQTRTLEVARARVLVGASLEKEAEARNLYTAGSIYYISRGSAVVFDR